MKKSILTILASLVIIFGIRGQELVCGNGSVVFSDIVCVPSNDSLQVVITANSVTQLNLDLQANTYSWKLLDGVANEQFPFRTVFFTNNEMNPYFQIQLTIPSTDCAPVNLGVPRIQDRPVISIGMSCFDLSVLLETQSDDVEPIPTLGQWGIIVLSILMLIIGVTFLKSLSDETLILQD